MKYMNRQRTKATQSNLDARAVRQMIHGYQRANKVTRAEECVWAMRLTSHQARQIFIELCQVWEHQRTNALKHTLEQLEIARTRREQQVWIKLAQRMERR